MIGDIMDMLQFVSAGRMMCLQEIDMSDEESDSESEGVHYFFEEAIRVSVAKAVNDLVTTFEAVEAAHRRQYGISGEKKPTPVSYSLVVRLRHYANQCIQEVSREYDQLLESRASLAVASFPRPTPSKKERGTKVCGVSDVFSGAVR